ncbi:hypothetical protein LXL04_004453 [Taraxacum kok-saghyz]
MGRLEGATKENRCMHIERGNSRGVCMEHEGVAWGVEAVGFHGERGREKLGVVLRMRRVRFLLVREFECEVYECLALDTKEEKVMDYLVNYKFKANVKLKFVDWIDGVELFKFDCNDLTFPSYNGENVVLKKKLNEVHVEKEIVVGQHAVKIIFLPKIPLSPSDDDMFPFKLKRKQFPVHFFVMTINKAQGQTIPNIGVYLPDPVFSYGQLYFALSRGISRVNTKVLVKPHEKTNGHKVYTSNVFSTYFLVAVDILQQRISHPHPLKRSMKETESPPFQQIESVCGLVFQNDDLVKLQILY